jgi:F0F1-type ATP synthase assembly protein I
LRAFGALGSIGFIFVAAIIVGYLFGGFIDKKLGIQPYGMLISLLLFVAGGFLESYKILKPFLKETDNDKDNR